MTFKRDQEGKQELSGRCFAWVQTYDEKPKRRLFELLQSRIWSGSSGTCGTAMCFQALNELQSLETDLDAAAFESKDENARKLLKGVEDLHTYVEGNREFVPNYGERYRNGERIASGFVESAINQVVSKRMVKKQQMGWSQRGAHRLLQIRTRVLDEEWENTFRRWYPDFHPSRAGQESGVTPRKLPLSLFQVPADLGRLAGLECFRRFCIYEVIGLDP